MAAAAHNAKRARPLTSVPPRHRGQARALTVRPAPQLVEGGAARYTHHRPARVAQQVQPVRVLLLGARGPGRVAGPGGRVQDEGDGAAAPAHPGDRGGLLLVQVAEEGDQQALAAAAQRVVGPGEVLAAGVVDHREGVQDQSGRVRGLLAAAREPVGALAGHRAAGVGQQPYREAPFEQVHQRGGGAGDGPLEGRVGARALVGAGAGVQQDGAAGAPGLFLAAHHQLAVAGGGAPVHAAQIVAVPVAARDDVVLARQGQGAPVSVAVAPGLAGEPGRGQRGHPGDDGEGVGLREGAGQFAHPEGVDEPQLERAERIAAAQVRADPVGHLAPAARLHPVQHEPGPGPEHIGHPVLEHQHPGGQPGDVLHPQPDPGLAAGRDARGGQRTGAGHPVAGVVEHGRAGQRQRGQQQADAQQFALAEHVGADRGGDPGRQEGAAAGGQTGQRGTDAARLRALGRRPLRPPGAHHRPRGGCWG